MTRTVSASITALGSATLSLTLPSATVSATPSPTPSATVGSLSFTFSLTATPSQSVSLTSSVTPSVSTTDTPTLSLSLPIFSPLTGVWIVAYTPSDGGPVTTDVLNIDAGGVGRFTALSGGSFTVSLRGPELRYSWQDTSGGMNNDHYTYTASAVLHGERYCVQASGYCATATLTRLVYGGTRPAEGTPTQCPPPFPFASEAGGECCSQPWGAECGGGSTVCPQPPCTDGALQQPETSGFTSLGGGVCLDAEGRQAINAYRMPLQLLPAELQLSRCRGECLSLAACTGYQLRTAGGSRTSCDLLVPFGQVANPLWPLVGGTGSGMVPSAVQASGDSVECFVRNAASEPGVEMLPLGSECCACPSGSEAVQAGSSSQQACAAGCLQDAFCAASEWRTAGGGTCVHHINATSVGTAPGACEGCHLKSRHVDVGRAPEGGCCYFGSTPLADHQAEAGIAPVCDVSEETCRDMCAQLQTCHATTHISVNTTACGASECRLQTTPWTSELEASQCRAGDTASCSLRLRRTHRLEGGKTCPAGLHVGNATECRAAAAAAGLLFTEPATGPLSGDPHGCWFNAKQGSLHYTQGGSTDAADITCPTAGGRCLALCRQALPPPEVATWKGCFSAAHLDSPVGPFRPEAGGAATHTYCYARCFAYRHYLLRHEGNGAGQACWCTDQKPATLGNPLADCSVCATEVSDTTGTVCVHQRRPSGCGLKGAVQTYTECDGSEPVGAVSAEECDAACTADTSCNYFSWDRRSQCRLARSGSCTAVPSSFFDTYTKAHCAYDTEALPPVPKPLAYPFLHAGRGGGLCQALSSDPTAARKVGWCGFQPSRTGVCKKAPDSRNTPFVALDGFCSCGRAACDAATGLCVLQTEAPVVITPVPTPDGIIDVNSTRPSLAYRGIGRCINLAGRYYTEYGMSLTHSSGGVYEGDAVLQEECKRVGVAAARDTCYVKGVAFIGRAAGGPQCILAREVRADEPQELRTSAGVLAFLSRGAAFALPSGGDGLAHAVCFAYLEDKCTYSDGCRGCQGECSVGGDGRCIDDTEGTACYSPCGGGFLETCTESRRASYNLTDKPASQWQSPAARESQRAVQTAGVARLLEYVFVTEAATCEEAGMVTMADEGECRIALCAASDTEFFADIPATSDGPIPAGCTARCTHGVGTECMFGGATFLSSGNTPSTTSCKESALRGIRCVCRKDMGPPVLPVDAAECPPLAAPATEYYLQDSGPGCGVGAPVSHTGVPAGPIASTIIDITDEAECRAAACLFYGVAVGTGALPRWGGFPVKGLDGVRPPYTGRLDGSGYTSALTGDEQWGGGCSVVLPVDGDLKKAQPYAVWSVPPNLCPGLDLASCTLARGCRVQAGVCVTLHEGFGLCTLATPCLCRRDPAAVDAPPPPPAPEDPHAYDEQCPISVDYFGSGKVVQCNPCRGSTSSAFQCTEGDYEDIAVSVAEGETWTRVYPARAANTVDLQGFQKVSVTKYMVSGEATLAAMVGGLPKLTGPMFNSSVAQYHCLTPFGTEASTATCTVASCGPLAVSVRATGGSATVTVRVCLHPNTEVECVCGRTAADGLPHGECATAKPPRSMLDRESGRVVQVPSSMCRCSANHGRSSASGDVDCTQCAEGSFPEYGSQVWTTNVTFPDLAETRAPACSLRCAQCGDVACGSYNPALERCFCLGMLSGPTCADSCAPGRYGMFCNETYVPLAYQATKDLQAAGWTSPPWSIAPQSHVSLVLSAGSAELLTRVQVRVMHSLPGAAVQPLPPLQPSAGTVQAAYYGPIMSDRAASVDEYYLHVLRGGKVYVYRFAPDPTRAVVQGAFTLHHEAYIRDYYQPAGLDVCASEAVFGPTYDTDYDGAVYVQARAGALQQLLLVKGQRVCYASGVDRLVFSLQGSGDISDAFALPWSWSLEVLGEPSRLNGFDPQYDPQCQWSARQPPCRDTTRNTSWDAVGTAFGSLVLVSGSRLRSISRFAERCCGETVQCTCWEGLLASLPGGYTPAGPGSGQVAASRAAVSSLWQAFAEGAVQDLGPGPAPVGALGSGTAFTAVAGLAGSVALRVTPPTLLFEEHRVHVLGFGDLRTATATATAMPTSELLPRMLLPSRLSVTTQSTTRGAVAIAGAGVVEGADALHFAIAVQDEVGRDVYLNNDRIVPLLLECGEAVSIDSQRDVHTLSNTSAAGLQDALWDERDCTSNTTATFVGSAALGVDIPAGAGQTDIAFSGIGITRTGRYLIRFVHAKSGAQGVSMPIVVVPTDCASFSGTAYECTSQCTPDEVPPGQQATLTCDFGVSSLMSWMQLSVQAAAPLSVGVSLTAVQACCHGRGLCCAGNAPCEGDYDYASVAAAAAATAPPTQCECFKDPTNGFWDQRHSCLQCKAGFSGSTCTDFIGPSAEAGFGRSLDIGDAAVAVFPVQAEAPVAVNVTGLSGQNGEDADVWLAFVACPGQEGIYTKGALAPGELAPVCSGHGSCTFDTAAAAGRCLCTPGYSGADCSQACCSGHGTCTGAASAGTEGTPCVCHHNQRDGAWAPAPTVCEGGRCSGPGGSDVHPASWCLRLADATGLLEGCAPAAHQGNSSRAWVSWRGLPAAGPGDLDHARLRINTTVLEGCTGAQPFHVYATLPEGTARGPPASRGSPSVPAGDWWQPGVLPCGRAVLPGEALGCGPSAELDPVSQTCVCRSGDTAFCLLGRCVSTSSEPRCDAPPPDQPGDASDPCRVSWAVPGPPSGRMRLQGGLCRCWTQQASSDATERLACVAGACVPQAASLQYTWDSTRLAGVLHGAADSPAEAKQLQWGWDVRSAAPAELLSQVGWWRQAPAAPGVQQHEVDVGAWLRRVSGGIQNATFDVSFVVVPGAGACPAAVQGAELVVRHRGRRQPSRLFLSLEDGGRSEAQHLHPFYAAHTFDSPEALANSGDGDASHSRKLLRYIHADVASGDAQLSKRCGTGASCVCPGDMMFQDAVDFTQVGEHMYFLAVGDVESAGGAQPGACNGAYQGAREIFHTKGYALDAQLGSGTGSSRGLWATRAASRLGTSVLPNTSNIDSVANMDVFTRAKELAAMDLPAGWAGSGSTALSGRMLVFASAHLPIPALAGGGGLPQLFAATLDSRSGALVQIWRAGKTSVFVSHVTVVRVGGRDYTFYLAQSSAVHMRYAPSDPPCAGKASTLGCAGAGASGPPRYARATRLDVWVFDGEGERRIAAAQGQNVDPCTHQQNHPGFTAVGGSVAFLFDDGVGGVGLHRWQPAARSTAAAARVTLVDTAGATYTPFLSPLHKGPAGMVAAGGHLVLPLALDTSVQHTGQQEPGCLAQPECTQDTVLHVFQKTMPCLNPGRGNVELYAVHLGNSSTGVATLVHDPNGPQVSSDPVWLREVRTPGRTGFVWVGHDGGATNIGVHLTNHTQAGVQHPAPQFLAPEQQTLYYTSTAGTTPGAWHTTALWRPGAPVDINVQVVWEGALYFWAYNATELNATYDSPSLDPGPSVPCNAPGRSQWVRWDSGGEGMHTNVMSGANVPAYAGCTRVLHRVDDDGTVSPVLRGGDADGVGAPRRQCCPPTYNTDSPTTGAVWPDTARQAGRVCKAADNTGGCPVSTAGVPRPAGCALCDASVYPRDGPPPLYSTLHAWKAPHAGWWFTGFQSAWAQSTGAAGGDAYRVGGFAWREHWPRTAAVWEPKAVPQRNDCDDCAPGFYGQGCVRSCPLPACGGVSRQTCLAPSCAWNATSSECRPVPCSGHPCSDGLLGSGACLCPEGTWGYACEHGAAPPGVGTTHLLPAAFDTTLDLGCTAGTTCTPTAAACAAWECGALNDEPCCGRAPAPLAVSATAVSVVSFATAGAGPLGGAGSQTLLVLREAERRCDGTTAAVLRVLLLPVDAGVDVQAVHGVPVEAPLTPDDVLLWNLSALPVLAEVLRTGPTGLGSEWVVPLDADALAAHSGTGAASVSLLLSATGGCRWLFTSREHHAGWPEDCADGRCESGNSAPRKAGYAIRASASHAALLAVTQGGTGSGVPAPAAEQHPLLRAEHSAGGAGPISRIDLEKMEQAELAPPALRSITQAALCSEVGLQPSVQCAELAPLAAGFGVLVVQGLSRTSSVRADVSWTPRGAFGSASLGACVRGSREGEGRWAGDFCLDCDFRYTGPTCSAYQPDACSEATCSPDVGACVWDTRASSLHQQCLCDAGYIGLDCGVQCSDSGTGNSSGCHGHGRCSGAGTCECHSDSVQGFWAGDSCNVCAEGMYGEACTKRCQCVNGVCDKESEDGTCTKGSCKAGFAGSFCDRCVTGRTGADCQVECFNGLCGKGKCGDGGCVCQVNYFRDVASRSCDLHCVAGEECHGNGVCPPPGVDTTPATLCTCYQDEVRGHWDQATRCKTCAASFWGTHCTEACRCNNHGTCHTVTGACECFNDGVRGHFSGTSCSLCASGYTGDACLDAVVAEGVAQIGAAYTFSSGHREAVVPSGARGAAHLYLTQETGAPTEIFFSSAGEVPVGTFGAAINVWSKPHTDSVDFRTAGTGTGTGAESAQGTHASRSAAYVGRIHVHTYGEGLLMGTSVAGMFTSGRFLYAVVHDTDGRSYVGRFWSVSGPRCLMCLALAGNRAASYTTLVGHSRVCTVRTCTPGQAVLLDDGEAGVVEGVASSSRTGVVLLDDGPRIAVRTRLAERVEVAASRLTAVPSVAPVGPGGRGKVLAWGRSPRLQVAFVAVQHGGACWLSVVHTGSETGFAAQEPHLLAASGTVTSLLVHNVAWSSEVVLLFVLGADGLGEPVLEMLVVRASSSSPYVGVRSVLQATPAICSVYVCTRLERLIPLGGLQASRDERLRHEGDTALLLVQTVQRGASLVVGYAAQRVNLSAVKDTDLSPAADHPLCMQHLSAEACRGALCTWDGAACTRVRERFLAGAQGRTGITGAEVDVHTGKVYLTVGGDNPTLPSVVLRIDALTLMYERSRALRYGASSADPQVAVGTLLDNDRGALFVSLRTKPASVLVLSLHEVESVSPDVSDLLHGGTQITVRGLGFFPLPGTVPLCRMGELVSQGRYALAGGHTGSTATHTIVCVAQSATTTSTACLSYPLEVSLSAADPRFSDSQVLVARIATPMILSLGTAALAAADQGDRAWLAAVSAGDVGVVGPVRDPWGGTDPRLIQAEATGPYNEPVAVVVAGAGFRHSAHSMCRMNGVVSSVTFASSLRVLCRQPVLHGGPARVTVEVTMDGQHFTASNTTRSFYYAVGDANKIDAFAVCSPGAGAGCMTALKSEPVTRLPTVAAAFKDSIGTFVGGVWTRNGGRVGQVAIDSTLSFSTDSVVTLQPSEGRVVFDRLWALSPHPGRHTLRLLYTDAAGTLADTVSFEIAEGSPVQLRFAVDPPSFSDNREPLDPQPEVRLEDTGNRSVSRSTWSVVAELDTATLPPELFNEYTQLPHVVVSSAVAAYSEQLGHFVFRGLHIHTTTLAGRDMQYGGGGELLSFRIVFRVYSNGERVAGIADVVRVMHLVDCSQAYVGDAVLGWVDPEEQHFEDRSPVSIRGWKYHGDVLGSYSCVAHDVATGQLAFSVAAVVVDSCTLRCDPFLPRTAKGAMLSVRPELVCAGAAAPDTAAGEAVVCNATHVRRTDGGREEAVLRAIAPFASGRLGSTTAHYRSIGSPARLGVFNLAVPLGPAVASASVYSSAVGAQARLPIAVEASASSLRRASPPGTRRSAAEYQLLMYSEAMVHTSSLLRAGRTVTIAGALTALGDAGADWLNTDAIRRAQAGTSNSTLRVAVLDKAAILNGWHGQSIGDTWVAHTAAAAAAAAAATNAAVRTEQHEFSVKLSIEAVDTYTSPTGAQYAILSPVPREEVVATVGGHPLGIVHTRGAYAEFGTIEMERPAAGTYRLRLDAGSLPVVDRIFTVREGLPHHVHFDAPGVAGWAGGRDGVPRTTLTNYKDLVVQPRFRLLDEVNNTLTDFPRLNDVRVRVGAVSPWPRCLPPLVAAEEDVTLPGMWGREDRTAQGVCTWNTLPLSNMSAGAVQQRLLYDPQFSSAGIAAYGAPGTDSTLNVWGQVGQEYSITFLFYGSGLDAYGYTLPPLSLPQPLRTSTCNTTCSKRVCSISPVVLVDLSSTDIELAGDFYDVAVSGAGPDSLRVLLTVSSDGLQYDTACELPAELVDPCHMRVRVPKCMYHCRNLYPVAEYSEEDRQSCCRYGHRVGGGPCGAVAGGRSAAVQMQASSASSDLFTGAAVTRLQVVTSCDSQSTCMALLSQAEHLTGPTHLGPPAQLGLGEATMLAPVPSASLASTTTFDIVLKDMAGSDVRDSLFAVRQLRVTVDALSTQGWDAAVLCTADNTTDCTTLRGAHGGLLPDGVVRLVGGKASVNLEFHYPRTTQYGIRIKDTTGTSSRTATSTSTAANTTAGTGPLPPCTGPMPSGKGTGPWVAGRQLPFPSSLRCVDTAFPSYVGVVTVTPGAPHRYDWVAPPSGVVEMHASVDYALYIADVSGNVLTTSDLQRSLGHTVPVVFQVQVSVPAFRDNSTGPLLLGWRAMNFTEEVIASLEESACPFRSFSLDFGLTDARQAAFGTPDFLMWRGVRCLLKVSLLTVDSAPQLQAMNEQVGGGLSHGLEASPCCTQEPCSAYAYSFEVGCWGHRGRKTGPLNPATSAALRTTTSSTPFQCLTECGVCEEGTVCYGNGTIVTKPEYFREPVTYRAWKCKSGQCTGGDVVPGIGPATPLATLQMAEHERADLQCGDGGTGPLCGECVQKGTPHAPHGYARSGDGCAECPSPAANGVILCVCAVVVIAFMGIMVAVNIQSGEIVRESSKLSVVMKMLTNHMQVLALSASFAIDWGTLMTESFNSGGSISSPNIVMLSLTCALRADYYAKYTGWLLLPVVILSAFLLLQLTTATRKAEAKASPTALRERAPECRSLYHWAYDWCVDPGEVESLRHNLRAAADAAAAAATASTDTPPSDTPAADEAAGRTWVNTVVAPQIDPRQERDMEGLKDPDAFPHPQECPLPIRVQGFRTESAEFAVKDMEVVWEHDLTPGTYGCWLCHKCCILEQLFPNAGVGRVGLAGQLEEMSDGWYTCDVPAHTATKAVIYQLFTGELLIACLARHDLLTRLRDDATPGEPLSTDDAAAAADSLFTHSRKKSSCPTESERLRGYSLSTTPPYPVKDHLPFEFPATAGESAVGAAAMHTTVFSNGLFLEADGSMGEEASLKRRVDGTASVILREQERVGQGVRKAKRLEIHSLPTAHSSKVYRVVSTDPVLNVSREYTSTTDPLTPPRSPPLGATIDNIAVLPTGASGFTLDLPAWYVTRHCEWLRAAQASLRPAAGKAREGTAVTVQTRWHHAATPASGMPLDPTLLFGGSEGTSLLPVRQGTSGTACFTLVELSLVVPYDQLFQAARLRRMSDKMAGWRLSGFSDDTIERRLSARADGLKMRRTSTWSSRKATLLSRTDTTHRAAAGTRQRLEALDAALEVIPSCAACGDFAVVSCPMCGKSLCERCDGALHTAGPREGHTRIVPLPRRSPLAEAGYDIVVHRTDVYTVTVVVVMFMLYPWLMREVSLMLSCTEPICMAEGMCHRYLEVDPSVDCDTSSYAVYALLSFCALVGYGVGIPALAFLQIWRRRKRLQTKAVVSTLGFLYSGYRRRWYFWECVTLLRKMLLVFIVVFLVRYPSYQLYAAAWLMGAFTLLNVLVRPYKDSNLWYLENLSLLSVVITYNLALVYIGNPSQGARTFVSIASFVLNVVVLVVFAIRIVVQAQEEVKLRTREMLVDDKVSCSTAMKYVSKKYHEMKPDFLLSQAELREQSRLRDVKRRWFEVSRTQRERNMEAPDGDSVLLTPAATMGYWLSKYQSRKDRFEVMRTWVGARTHASKQPARPPHYSPELTSDADSLATMSPISKAR